MFTHTKTEETCKKGYQNGLVLKKWRHTPAIISCIQLKESSDDYNTANIICSVQVIRNCRR